MALKRKNPTQNKRLPAKSTIRRNIRSRDMYATKAGAIGKNSLLNEPIASYTTKIRAIGNSRGVILNNQLLDAVGLGQEADIVVQALGGVIVIQAKELTKVNAVLSTWDKQFKDVIKKGARPEKDLFEGMNNNFDSKEW